MKIMTSYPGGVGTHPTAHPLPQPTIQGNSVSLEREVVLCLEDGAGATSTRSRALTAMAQLYETGTLLLLHHIIRYKLRLAELLVYNIDLAD